MFFQEVSVASYVPLPEPVIEKNGTLLIYYEPLNVYTNKKNGLYEIWYTQDMEILSDKDKLIYKKEDMLSFHYTTTAPILDLFATNTVELTGLPKGKYKFRAVLKDRMRNKTAAKVIWFAVK